MSSSDSSSKAKPTSGSWTVDAGGIATWSAGTLTPNSSYNLTVPVAALAFNVATPLTRTKEFSLRTTLAQLAGGGTPSTFTGTALSKDMIKISDASGVVTDGLFANCKSVEALELQGSGGFSVTLAATAQAAGLRDVEGGDGADLIDASGYTTRIELEGDRGNDTLIGGQGNDKIEGGKGADQIDLTAGGSDRVIYESRLDGSSEGLAGQSFSGYDAITGFTAGDDKIDIDYRISAVESIDGGAGFDFTNVDAVVALMTTAVTGDVLTSGSSVIFVINDGTSSALYSATVVDADLTGGVEAVSNPYMLATVNAILTPADVI